MNHHFAPYLLLTLVSLSGCGESDSPPASGEEPATCSAFDFSAFDAGVSDFLRERGAIGASSVVVHEDCGLVHSQGYGKYAADRVYLVGSASKVLSAGILMRLADQGLLDVDAPIGEYLPAAELNGKSALTVAQLLSNSSGLVGLLDNPAYRPYRCQYQDGGTLAECAGDIYTANDAADRTPPDTAFRYGGAQWQLAGGIAEAASGKSWADLVQETYVEPCDVPSIGYTNHFARAAQSGGVGGAFEYPAFFQGDPASLPLSDNPNIEGGLYTSALDYGKLLHMQLRRGECPRGRVLSAPAVARMQVDRILEAYGGSTSGQTGRTAGGDAGALAGYGLGWWIDRQNPGVFADPGLYGAFPWLDLPRKYGALIALEADGTLGAELWIRVKPLLDEVFDAVPN
jgi:CubicO group peptidase (beta-lactamase class C family)